MPPHKPRSRGPLELAPKLSHQLPLPLPTPPLCSGQGHANCAGQLCVAALSLRCLPKIPRQLCQPVRHLLNPQRPHGCPALAAAVAAAHTVRLVRPRRITMRPPLLRYSEVDSERAPIQRVNGCCKDWRQPMQHKRLLPQAPAGDFSVVTTMRVRRRIIGCALKIARRRYSRRKMRRRTRFTASICKRTPIGYRPCKLHPNFILTDAITSTGILPSYGPACIDRHVHHVRLSRRSHTGQFRVFEQKLGINPGMQNIKLISLCIGESNVSCSMDSYALLHQAIEHGNTCNIELCQRFILGVSGSARCRLSVRAEGTRSNASEVITDTGISVTTFLEHALTRDLAPDGAYIILHLYHMRFARLSLTGQHDTLDQRLSSRLPGTRGLRSEHSRRTVCYTNWSADEMKMGESILSDTYTFLFGTHPCLRSADHAVGPRRARDRDPFGSPCGGTVGTREQDPFGSPCGGTVGTRKRQDPLGSPCGGTVGNRLLI